jgi:MFS family permease
MPLTLSPRRDRNRPRTSRSSSLSGWHLLKTREFALLWAGQALTQTGDSLIKVALLWFVYTLTGSALKMTVIGLLQTLPPFLLGPIIGVYVDRWRKKSMLVRVDLIRAALIVTIPILHAFNLLTLNTLYAIVFLVAVVSSVFGPALFSTVALIAPREQLTAANAVLQSTTTMGMLIGPALSGTGIAWIGAPNMLYIGAAGFLLASLMLMSVQIKERVAPPPAKQTAWRMIWEEMWIGVCFLFVHSPVLRLLMITSALFSLAASAFVFLLPVFSDRVLNAGAQELGWLWSSYGGGMLVVSIVLACSRRNRLTHRVQLIAGSMLLGGLATCSLTMVQTLLPALVLVTVIGGSLALFTPVVWGMLQELTSAELRGRVFTIFSSGAMLASMLGMLAFGWVTDLFGPTPSLIVMGLVLGVTGGLSPTCRWYAVRQSAISVPLGSLLTGIAALHLQRLP